MVAPFAGAASSRGGRWSVQGGDEDDAGMRQALRAMAGCAHADFAQLRPDERADCDRRDGREVRLSGAERSDVLPTAKRVYFDEIADAYRQVHDPRPGPPNGHMPTIGCKLGGKGAPPNSLKLGPCFISPPQGLLTEESAVQRPY